MTFRNKGSLLEFRLFVLTETLSRGKVAPRFATAVNKTKPMLSTTEAGKSSLMEPSHEE